jgi:predicted DNA-binding protein with PD1-like motif
MKSRLLHEAAGQRTYAVILETGDESMERLQTFADREEISAAQLTAIGALSDAVLGYFDWETKRYRRNPVSEQVEVASLIGDVALSPEGKPSLHVHVVLGRRDGSAVAGHLLEARVRPTLEVVLMETPRHLRRVHDPETGLALIRPDERPRVAAPSWQS